MSFLSHRWLAVSDPPPPSEASSVPEQQVNEIVVNTRTIRIIDDIIALSQVVRLRVIQYKDNPGFSPGRRLLVNLAFAIAFFGFVLNSLSPFGSQTAAGLMVTGISWAWQSSSTPCPAPSSGSS